MMRVYDRVGGATVPMVVIVHALGSTCSELTWRLTGLRASGDVEVLFPGGMLALEESLPRDIDWAWMERLALLLDDVETMELVSLSSAHETPSSISCVDSSYWEICGSTAVLDSVRNRFDAVEAR